MFIIKNDKSKEKISRLIYNTMEFAKPKKSIKPVQIVLKNGKIEILKKHNPINLSSPIKSHSNQTKKNKQKYIKGQFVDYESQQLQLDKKHLIYSSMNKKDSIDKFFKIRQEHQQSTTPKISRSLSSLDERLNKQRMHFRIKQYSIKNLKKEIAIVPVQLTLKKLNINQFDISKNIRKRFENFQVKNQKKQKLKDTRSNELLKEEINGWYTKNQERYPYIEQLRQ